MRLWRWLFRQRGEVLTHEQKDADLVDAQERLGRLEQNVEDRDRRLRRLGLEVDVRRRGPR